MLKELDCVCMHPQLTIFRRNRRSRPYPSPVGSPASCAVEQLTTRGDLCPHLSIQPADGRPSRTEEVEELQDAAQQAIDQWQASWWDSRAQKRKDKERF